MNKKEWLQNCIKKEIGPDLMLAAMAGGSAGMRARKQFVDAMNKCQQQYCDHMAMEDLLEMVRSGKADGAAVLKVLTAHKECSPDRCPL